MMILTLLINVKGKEAILGRVFKSWGLSIVQLSREPNIVHGGKNTVRKATITKTNTNYIQDKEKEKERTKQNKTKQNKSGFQRDHHRIQRGKEENIKGNRGVITVLKVLEGLLLLLLLLFIFDA